VQCDFETDLGVAPLRMTLKEVRGDSVLGTYEYTTPLTGLVTGELRGDLSVTEPVQDQPEGSCTYRLQEAGRKSPPAALPGPATWPSTSWRTVPSQVTGRSSGCRPVPVERDKSGICVGCTD